MSILSFSLILSLHSQPSVREPNGAILVLSFVYTKEFLQLDQLWNHYEGEFLMPRNSQRIVGDESDTSLTTATAQPSTRSMSMRSSFMASILVPFCSDSLHFLSVCGWKVYSEGKTEQKNRGEGGLEVGEGAAIKRELGIE